MDDKQLEAGFFKSRFPEIESERLVLLTAESRGWWFPPVEGREAYLGIFIVEGQLKDGRRLSLTKRIIEAAAERGVSVYPTLYEQAEWRKLTRGHEGHEWEERLVPGARAQQLVSTAKREEHYPRRTRSEMLALLRENSAVVHAFVESPTEQQAYCLPVLLRMVHETFGFLSAILDKPYRGDHRDIGQLGRALTVTGHFEGADIFLVPYLVALTDQAGHLQGASKNLESRACQDAADAVLGFFKRTKTFVASELMSDVEKKRKWFLNTIAAVAGVVLVSAVAMCVWALTRPPGIGSPVAHVGQPGGISASYYKGKRFDRFVITKNTDTIGIPKWSSPVPGVKPNRYSVRWEGYLRINETGEQTICTDNDDGVVVYINGKEVISDWATHPPRKNCARVDVDAAGWYPLRVDFYEDIGPGSIVLSLGKTEETAAPVPASQLCCKAKHTVEADTEADTEVETETDDEATVSDANEHDSRTQDTD